MSPAKKTTKAAKPKARKAPARKKTAKKAAAKPSATKASKRKATKAKTAKPKKPKKAKAIKADHAGGAPAQARARAPSTRSRKKPASAPAAEVLPARTPVSGEPRFRLGSKWECFSCGAKFYDLHRPEPLCPKCGANQLDRPKEAPKQKSPPPAPARASRVMAPLLEDDEDTMVVENEDIDLGVAGVDEAVGEFIDTGESDEDSFEDEDEEP